MRVQMQGKTGGRRAGFTMIELMMVILIIAILAGFVLAISGYVSRKNDRSKAAADMEKIKNALEEFRVVQNQYWPYTQDINDDANRVLDRTFLTWLTNLVVNCPTTDPWGRTYKYTARPGPSGKVLSFTLLSYGPDGTNSADDVCFSQGNM